MKILWCIAGLIFTVTPVSAIDYEPWTCRQDFETRETMGWSSYPPIQDAAYEAPYIYPGTIQPGEQGTVLCKIIYPQWNAPQLTGVVKRLSMRLDDRSRVRFRYYIKSTVKPSWLGIDLPMANGDRVRSRFMNPETNRWVLLDLGIADILKAAGRAPAGELDITALAVTVRFESADPDIPIAAGFDDFSVSGYREAQFTFVEPRTESLDEWDSAIALNHYREGDTLSIRGTCASSSPDNVTVSITRFDRPEKTVYTEKLDKDGDSWTLHKPPALDGKRFPAGMYEVTLTGERKKEIVARSIFTFMVMDDRRFASHPRLWFDSEGREAFVARLKQPKNAAFLEKIRSDAREGREKYSTELPYDLDYFPEKGWLSSFEPYRTRIATIPQRAEANAIVSVVDGDEEAAEWAKQALIALCRWPTWTHPWMVNRGHHIYLYQYYTTCNLALTYDILYDRLTEEERDTVRQAMIRNGLEPAYRTYVVADQCTCNESNWIPAIVGGALAGATAILGETGDTTGLEPMLSGCLYKLRAHMNTVYDGDSGCLEGYGYGYGTMRIYTEILPFFEKCLNIDMSPMLDRQYTEGFWAADHDAGLYFTFGDARITPPDMSAFPWLLEKFRDPELAWFYDLNPPTPSYYTFHTVLYDIDDIPRKQPGNLTGAKWFRKTGTVVFRSGPGPEPFVLTFRCGPFGNHQHLDQGTFFLSDRGRLLITEQEYSDYYNDPFYQSHIIQPIGHNCVLVDHNPQSQRTGDHGDYAAGMNDHARITSFVNGRDMAFALGDLTPLYLGNVKRLERGILYIAPRTAVVIDRLETQQGEASMDVLFHGPKLSDMVLADEDVFTVSSGITRLAGIALGQDARPSLTLDADPVKLGMLTDNPIEPLGRVTVNLATSGGKAVSAVILSTELHVRKSQSFGEYMVIEFDDVDVLINRSGTAADNGSIGTDGLCAALSRDGGFLLAGATFGSIKGKTVVNSDRPITVLIEQDAVSYSTVEPAALEILSPERVHAVMVNGEKIKGWKYDRETGFVSLGVPAGQGSIELKK
ncbi:heparinase II/III-family protein [bacterium]|nr:heparinase II/III-family protein [bacterium]